MVNVFKAKVYIKTPSEAPQGVKVEEGKRGGHYYESSESSKQSETKPEEIDNIEIIIGEIKEEHILDSLETFAEEGNIEALPPPTKEEVQYWIKESKIPKDRKIVVIPYFSETVNAYCHLGGNIIYLMSNNAELDKEVLEETRAECFKVGYDITNMTLENRRVGTLSHEEGHIRTYEMSGITENSEKDEERLHYTFQKYEETIMEHFKKDIDTIFDFEVLLELIAEDFRIGHGGKGASFPHRYFYIDDIQNPQFKQDRANILKKMGMI